MANPIYYSVFVIVNLFMMAHVHPATTNVSPIKSEHNHEMRMSQLRRISRQTAKGNGNGLVDEAIPMWKTWLLENGYDPVTIKGYDVKVGNFLVKLLDCRVAGLSTFKRTGDITVNASEAGFAAEANVGIEKIAANCKIEVRWSFIRAFGVLIANISEFSVESTVVQIRPPPRITSLRITNQGNIFVEFDGDGFIGTIFQWLSQGYLKYKTIETLSDIDKVIEIANDAISGIDVENVVDLY